jgi:transcriptional regulator with GAF, ATPase, and Fis domain
VLLLGETGTGKEEIARLIHDLDSRESKGEFVILDCSTIVPDLAGSEFFGHERGAFTGAVSARDGAFAVADGGTLFLDEIGELPPLLQVQLLRVVQERMYKRVGSNTWRRTNFRLICATNRNLLSVEQDIPFRRDLYYRIAVWVCSLPALRDRPEDIIPLAEHFIRKSSPGVNPPELDEQVCDYLNSRAYPGNVRDLRNVVLRMVGRHIGPGSITIGDIPGEERPRLDLVSPAHEGNGSFESAIREVVLQGAGLSEVRRIAEETAIRIVTEDEDGNLQRAAKRLGVTDRTLQIRRVASRTNGAQNGQVAIEQ